MMWVSVDIFWTQFWVAAHIQYIHFISFSGTRNFVQPVHAIAMPLPSANLANDIIVICQVSWEPSEGVLCWF